MSSYLILTSEGYLPEYRINPFQKPQEDDIRELWLEFGPKGILPEEVGSLIEWLVSRPEILIRLSDADRTYGFKLNLDSLKMFSFASHLKIALDTLKTVQPFILSPSLRKLHFSATNKVQDWELLSSAPNLEVIELHHLKLSDVSFICSLPRLKVLHLTAMSKLKSLDCILDCSLLEELDLGYFQISIPSLNSLKQLRKLSFVPRSPEDLKAVAQAHSLEDITFESPDESVMQIKSFDCFKDHPSLKQIHVTGPGWRRLRDDLCRHLNLLPLNKF